MMFALPTGTVTFLFSDIEGSTQLLQKLGEEYSRVLQEQHKLLRVAFEKQEGIVVDTQGDSFFVAFPRALDAVQAAADAQRALFVHDWGNGIRVQVRMGLHTGEPTLVGERYVGMDVHRAARIGAAGHGGQVLLSETTHALVRDDLPDGIVLSDLGEHRLKDLRTSKHLYQLVLSDVPSKFPPLKTLHTLPNNLPIQLTSFIGRERQVGEVARLLPTTRLLTLTGVGGTGKTRLALRVGAELIETFQHGVWLVELASITNPDLVPQTVASALQLHEQASRSAFEAVREFLKPRELLLLLDNCEHLVDACAQFADQLLRHCPKLHILATSREPLGILGEVILSVPSLALPDTTSTVRPDALVHYEAVQLFVERAQAVQSNFGVSTANAWAVAQVCTRLDGIPLALELAAARVRGLGVEQIAARLDHRFRLLTGGSRTAVPRQQTLGALIDWSYDLLSDSEQKLFRHLAVFAGSFPLEAAEEVCRDEDIAPSEVLDLLLRLVDKSLVLTEAREGDLYYRLLETIRQYARERLFGSGKAERLGEQHAQFFLRLSIEADRTLRGPNQIEWLHRLGVLRENLRAALEWLMETGQTAAAMQMACKLDWFWFIRGDHTEGRQWLERVLALPDAPLFFESYAEALSQLAHHTWLQIGVKEARPHAEQALAIARAHKDTWNTAKALISLGLVLTLEKEYAAAQTNLEESKALFREVQDEWGYAHAVLCLALAPYSQDDRSSALALHEQALELFRKVGDRYFEGVALRFIGNLQVLQGDWTSGAAALRDALLLAQQLDSKWEIAAALWSLAEAAQSAGNPTHAVYQYWAARNILHSIAGWRQEDNSGFEHSLAACRASLGEAEFAAAVVQGRTLTLDEAVADALGKE